MAIDPYSKAVLSLAAEIPHAEPLAEVHGRARKTSRICGSQIEVALRLETDRIAAVSLNAQACALGQAAASVFAANAQGASLEEVRQARDALRAMLKTGGPAPSGRFADLAALEGARTYPMRHQSILLAFEAGLEAFEAALSARRPAA